MANIEELMPLRLAKGCEMRLFIDHSKDANDSDHNWVEATYDGEEGSQVFQVPRHWHEDHDEIMEVLVGRMKVYVDGKEFILSAGDAPAIIPRGSVHGLDAFAGEKLTVREKTIPAGDKKSLFFQDLFRDGNPSFFLAMRVFYDADAYASLPGNIKFVDKLFVTVIGFIAKAFAPARLTALKKKGEEREVTNATNSGYFF